LDWFGSSVPLDFSDPLTPLSIVPPYDEHNTLILILNLL
jgi:hypothetical protein